MPQLWLVDRTYDDKGMIQLTYATEDGEQTHRREIAEQRLQMGHEITAARDTETDDVVPTDDENVERYAEEAAHMSEQYDPDDPV